MQAIRCLALVAILFASSALLQSRDRAVAAGPSLELELKRGSLENVDDKAGRWQFEGGKAFRNGKLVANYASVKRVVFGGTDDQNTAMLTLTLFFLGKQPPENVTLQGAHDFNSGDELGSVSAASAAHSSLIGKTFLRKNDKLTIN